MSSAQRSEGLCSKTFCSRCIRSEQRTISGAAWTQHYLQMQINLKTIAKTNKQRLENNRSRASESPAMQNPVEMQPWIQSDHNCSFADDTQRATLGLLQTLQIQTSYHIRFKKILPSGQSILSNIIKTNQRRFERVFNLVKGWQEAFDIAIVTYHAHCQRHIRRGCWERICNQAVVVKPGPTNLRDGRRHSHSPRPSAKGKGHRRTKQC